MGGSAAHRLEVDMLEHDLFRDHEPWEVFEALQREAPAHFHPEPDGRGFWVITEFDDVRAVLKDYRTFSSEVGVAAARTSRTDSSGCRSRSRRHERGRSARRCRGRHRRDRPPDRRPPRRRPRPLRAAQPDRLGRLAARGGRCRRSRGGRCRGRRGTPRIPGEGCPRPGGPSSTSRPPRRRDRGLETPFGGARDSGIGREGGHHSVYFHCDVKTVCERRSALR